MPEKPAILDDQPNPRSINQIVEDRPVVVALRLATAVGAILIIVTWSAVVYYSYHSKQLSDTLSSQLLVAQLDLAETLFRAETQAMIRVVTEGAGEIPVAELSDRSSENSTESLLTAYRSNLLSEVNSILTWLANPGGPSVPLRSISGSRELPQPAWRVTRGLPLRGARNNFLAPKVRSQLQAILRRSPQFDQAVLLDSSGHVLVSVPFEKQLSLATTDFSSHVAREQESPRDAFLTTISEHELGQQGGGRRLSAAMPLAIRGRVGHLLLVRTRSLSQNHTIASPIRIVLADDKNEILLTNSTQSLESLHPGISSKVDLFGLSLSLRVHQEGGSAKNSVYTLVFIPLAVSAFSIALLTIASRTILAWVGALRRQLAQVESTVRARATNLAHDFRSKILSLRSHVTSISKDKESTIPQIVSINNAINELSAYADQLTTAVAAGLSRVEWIPLGSIRDEAAPETYLRGTLENLVNQHRSALSGKGQIRLDFGTACDGGELFVQIERSDLTRILSNLLDNSMQSAKRGRPLEIEIIISRTGAMITITITDNGIGISQADQAKLFRSSFTTKPGTNRGNGLTSCRERAQRCGGQVELAKSTVDVGSSFNISLKAASTPEWFINKINVKSGATVVVVDDDSEIGDHWRNVFQERLRGIKVASGFFPPELVIISGRDDFAKQFQSFEIAKSIFLIDYRLSEDESYTGLDLIREFKLEQVAILVTNHFEKDELIDVLIRSRIKMIPKIYMYGTRLPLEFG